ncbi:MAG: orotate phosphoribosyltransferase [Elusimicrobia bacterium CG_4_10_14_0_2_um_filter_56_8]|nr:MAG: orotate phosphoribosyltransferase [Elusimicrobia bacterium CG1_02_56_21]PJA12982.1 MAG: orotate phosphoribosyltransferase [Elusimicrobia bacterium CG_4_10_14_0_2_um_filter_56_8]
MIEEAELKSYLSTSGAFLEGHFRLSSGLHSPNYVQCAQALKNPVWAGKMGAALAAAWKGPGPDLILSPAMGGLIIGHEVARAFGVDFIFTERENSVMTLRRGFSLPKGARLLIVEDVITTGKSTLETSASAAAAGAETVGALSVINRMGEKTLPFPFISLLKLDLTAYRPENCPLCRDGVPVLKPGSRIFA